MILKFWMSLSYIVACPIHRLLDICPGSHGHGGGRVGMMLTADLAVSLSFQILGLWVHNWPLGFCEILFLWQPP